jgi:hypothetical protein
VRVDGSVVLMSDVAKSSRAHFNLNLITYSPTHLLTTIYFDYYFFQQIRQGKSALKCQIHDQ